MAYVTSAEVRKWVGMRLVFFFRYWPNSPYDIPQCYGRLDLWLGDAKLWSPKNGDALKVAQREFERQVMRKGTPEQILALEVYKLEHEQKPE